MCVVFIKKRTSSSTTSLLPVMTTSSTSALRRLSLLINRYHHRHSSFFSSSGILTSRYSTTKLTSKEKCRAAVALLKTENNPDRILEICREASLTPDSHHGRIAFSVAISKLADSNCFEGIRSFVEELKRRPDLRNERFASHSMILYAQAGMIQNAISSFENIEEFGIDRSVKTLNSLLFACLLAKEYDEARRIFFDFPKRYKIKPDLDTYNFMIKAFCESGLSSSGYSVVAEMERAGCKLNETTFEALIEGFYREEKFEDVRKVLKMIDDHRIKPGLGVFNIRIKSLCKLGRSMEAGVILDTMLSRGMQVNVVSYNYLIHGFCKEGNPEEAKRLFKSMKRTGCEPDSSSYFTLIHFLCEGGDFEAALQLCKECMRKKWVPYFTTMKLLVEGLASISMADEAQELIDKVKEKFPKNAELWKEAEASLRK